MKNPEPQGKLHLQGHELRRRTAWVQGLPLPLSTVCDPGSDFTSLGPSALPLSMRWCDSEYLMGLGLGQACEALSPPGPGAQQHPASVAGSPRPVPHNCSLSHLVWGGRESSCLSRSSLSLHNVWREHTRRTAREGGAG